MVTGCNGSRISLLFDRWMSLLLTDNASPESSDGMMLGFLMEKLVIVAISLILLIFIDGP